MKDSFIIEGKKYISSRRASQISDYASDYIGQLCRANKLDCKMIGRSWFVTEESLHLHKAAISREEAYRNRIENLKGSPASTLASRNTVPSPSTLDSSSLTSSSSVSPVATPLVQLVTNTTLNAQPSVVSNVNSLTPSPITSNFVSVTENSYSGIKSPFVYSVDERPLLPILNTVKTDSSIKSDNNVTKNVVAEESKIIEQIKIIENKKASISSAKKSSPKTVSNIFSKISYPELTRSIILRRAIAPLMVVVMFFVLGTGTYIAVDKVNDSVSTQFANSANVVSPNINSVLGSIYRFVDTQYKSVVAFFTSPAKLALEIPKATVDVSVTDVTPNGIVLTSSTGVNTADEILKEKIAGSFSDEVTVSPDKSGTAGVITPVFKETKGKDFVYVMVPVKDKAATALP
jgi:hypothetical protein